TVVTPYRRQPLNERRVDRSPFDGRGDGAWNVDQREELGVGKPLADDLERLLAAAHAREPVVREGEPHGCAARSGAAAAPAGAGGSPVAVGRGPDAGACATSW